MFRTLFDRAPDLVRSGRDATPKRLAAIDRHLAETIEMLHTHHHGEDIMLWERLEDRAPACALHVARMRAQHEDIGVMLDDATKGLADWQADREGARDALVAQLEKVRDALAAHLADEEENIRPVATEFLRQGEWDGLAEHGMAAIPPDRRLVQLGWVLNSFDNDTERREFWGKLPAPARALYRLFGARKVNKEWLGLFGKPFPGLRGSARSFRVSAPPGCRPRSCAARPSDAAASGRRRPG